MRSVLIFILFFTLLESCTTQATKQEKQIPKDSIHASPTPAKHDSNKVKAARKTDSSTIDTAVENLITDSIVSLPEIEKFSNDLEKESKGKAHAQFFIDPPDSQAPYYWVHAGYSDSDMFHTQFHFHVVVQNKKIKSIKYYDVVNDTDLTLSVWRKSINTK